jgi:hypothetical protein
MVVYLMKISRSRGNAFGFIVLIAILLATITSCGFQKQERILGDRGHWDIQTKHLKTPTPSVSRDMSSKTASVLQQKVIDAPPLETLEHPSISLTQANISERRSGIQAPKISKTETLMLHTGNRLLKPKKNSEKIGVFSVLRRLDKKRPTLVSRLLSTLRWRYVIPSESDDGRKGMALLGVLFFSVLAIIFIIAFFKDEMIWIPYAVLMAILGGCITLLIGGETDNGFAGGMYIMNLVLYSLAAFMGILGSMLALLIEDELPVFISTLGLVGWIMCIVLLIAALNVD